MSSRTFRSNDSANVAMMFGLLMFPLMAAAGMAIDMMRISNEKTEIAEALDAGLLAAARAYMFDNSLTKAEATAIARKSFDANFTPTAGTTISDFNFNQIPGQQKYTLKLEGEMKTALLGAIGRKTVDLDMDAEAQVRLPGPIEVVMVLDNTGSMAGTKLSDLQDAAKELIDTLEGVDLAEFSYGLVPFSEYVNVDTANSGASWLDETAVGGSTWDGCVGSRSSSNDRVDANYATEQVPAVVGVQCPQEIMPLTGTVSTVKTNIDNMTAVGNTYIATGLSWGLRVISSDAPFTGGVAYADMDALKAQKIIVLMTDGANTISPTYPLHDGTNVAQADTKLEEMCDEVKIEDIRLYTVAFEVSDTTIEGILSDCATANGGYFDAANGEALKSAFRSIATDIIALSLTK